jgi:hypothetical protein
LAHIAEDEATGTAHQPLQFGQSSLRGLAAVAQAQEENPVTTALVAVFPATDPIFRILVWSHRLRIKGAEAGQVVFAQTGPGTSPQ